MRDIDLIIIAWVSYHLGGSPAFMHLLWTLGHLANCIFSEPEPLTNRPIGIEQTKTRSALNLIQDQ